jgi:putative transposase
MGQALKYHIIWCTKYRYRVLTGEVAQRVRELVREICTTNYVDVLSGSMSPDHIHLLVSVPPSISISKLMQYIKGKSSRKVLMEFQHLRKRYWGQHMWARGYFVVSVGNLNEKEMQEYIENQEEHHKQDNFEISGH